jgi:hypothetical protein
LTGQDKTNAKLAEMEARAEPRQNKADADSDARLQRTLALLEGLWNFIYALQLIDYITVICHKVLYRIHS